MPIEHVNRGGEIILHRDPKVPSVNPARDGSFTLEAVRDFCLEAEVHGVDPKTTLRFKGCVNSYTPTALVFLTDQKLPERRPIAELHRHTVRLTFAFIAVLIAVTFVFGLGVGLAFG